MASAASVQVYNHQNIGKEPVAVCAEKCKLLKVIVTDVGHRGNANAFLKIYDTPQPTLEDDFVLCVTFNHATHSYDLSPGIDMDCISVRCDGSFDGERTSDTNCAIFFVCGEQLPDRRKRRRGSTATKRGDRNERKRA